MDGCTAKREYRLVRDWERGACGMDYLLNLKRRDSQDRDRSRFEGLHRRESRNLHLGRVGLRRMI